MGRHVVNTDRDSSIEVTTWPPENEHEETVYVGIASRGVHASIVLTRSEFADFLAKGDRALAETEEARA